MNKKKTLITLIIIAVIGSFVAFYASNLFFNDVLNFAVGFSRMTILASLPALMIGAMFVTATLYLVRLYKRPKTTKRLSKTYSFIFMALSFVGFITALLAGLLTYKSFVKPYPFPGYLLIALILNLLILGGTVFVFIRFVLKLKDDEETFKVTPKHVFHTLGLFLLIALAYNRFGGFLFMPFYLELRNFNETFVMYLYLLIPMALYFVLEKEERTYIAKRLVLRNRKN